MRPLFNPLSQTRQQGCSPVPDDAAMASETTNSPMSSGTPIGATPTPANSGAGSEYGADQIQVLEGLEAVRKRPGMYIGGTGLGPLHHLIYEVVDNSIDEAMAGYASTVWVTIEADGSCSVIDNGRGIPVEPKKHESPLYDGKPAIEIAMTVLHAGGKFGQEGSAYKVSGGLHGVGVSCVNALSEWLEAEVYRNGQVHMIGFSRGKTVKPLKVIGPVPAGSAFKTGTKVTFLPDPQIFPDTRFDYAVLQNRLRELAFLNPGVVIHLTDERVGSDGNRKQETFSAKDGLKEYVEHLMMGKQAVSSIVHVSKDDPTNYQQCEVALQYHDGYNETLLTFSNNINNKDGGTHGQGFKLALTRVLNAYAKKNGILKENDPTPTGEDLREGLIAIISVKLPNPTYNNQPKEKLLNPEIEKFVSDAVGESLDTWLEENPGEARRLCLKGIIAAQAREAARKARELTRRKSALDSGSMPHKLRDCKTKDFERSEMFIVEGDSAGGSATQGRDVDTQAILPLRGKLLNVEKARLDKVLGFEEIRTLISALRCGIGPEMDIAKLRYGKVIIMTDADVDGSHIRTLLLTFFFRQMPELIRRGRVYVAQPPLYQLAWGTGRNRTVQYVLNQGELDRVLTEQGLTRATLLIRDSRRIDAPVVRTLAGDEVRRLVRLLQRMEELAAVVGRRGVKFGDLISQRANDPLGQHRLPTIRMTWQAGEAFAWSQEQVQQIVEKHGLVLELAEGQTKNIRQVTVRELHENRELEKLFEQLKTFGLTIEDYLLKTEQANSGQIMPAKFAWQLDASIGQSEAAAASTAADDEDEGAPAGGGVARQRPKSDGKLIEAASLPAILENLHEVGRRGLEVKRFKGLGEMDPEQLWETTMDVTKRTLMRVSWDVASEAERLFSILMGEDVEQRRRYIEEHALEVKNLDV
jgi:DNA gyrase subunit B